MRKEDPQSVARVLTSKNISVWIPKIKINHDFTNQNSNIKHNTVNSKKEHLEKLNLLKEYNYSFMQRQSSGTEVLFENLA